VKTLTRTHRYLSCFIAPAMIFFAVSGAWQSFRLHEDNKDGSYHAPAALAVLSQAHKAERLSKTTGIWLKAGEVAIAAAFLVTAVLGLIMGVRLAGGKKWAVWSLLAAGTILPILIAVASRK
jgi:hypothetical protein